ncbi:MAG: hypothetical protein NWQ17_07965 [Polaribacter sp.]|nr:hypothetical protein [Polaribacter sp.]
MLTINFKNLTEQVHKRFYKSKLNLDIAKKEYKRSYFNARNKNINVEILTESKDFIFKNAFYKNYFNVEYLIFHITNGKLTSTRSNPPEYLMKIEIPNHLIQNCSSTSILNSDKNEFKVIVFNDVDDVNCSNLPDIINDYNNKNESLVELKRPGEAGGGVIIEGP